MEEVTRNKTDIEKYTESEGGKGMGHQLHEIEKEKPGKVRGRREISLEGEDEGKGDSKLDGSKGGSGRSKRLPKQRTNKKKPAAEPIVDDFHRFMASPSFV